MWSKAILPIFLIILYSVVVTAGTPNVSVQQIPAPPHGLFQKILDFVAEGYNWLVGLIQGVLQNTLLKQDPQLASSYANIIAWLVPLTALYVLLTFIEITRKYLGYLIVAGWIFLLVVMILAH